MKRGQKLGSDMENRLYEYMDWAAIEAVVYAEEAHPEKLLGPHVTKDGVLLQAFFPGRKEVSVKLRGGREIPMIREDDAGYFAILLDARRVPAYTYILKACGSLPEIETADPYSLSSIRRIPGTCRGLPAPPG